MEIAQVLNVLTSGKCELRLRRDGTGACCFHYKLYRTICLFKLCPCVPFIKIKIEFLAAVWRIGWRRARMAPGQPIEWSRGRMMEEQ